MTSKKPLIAALAVLASVSLVAGAADAKRGGRPKPKPTRTTTTVASTSTVPGSVTTSTTPATTSDSLIDVARSGQRLGYHPKHSRDVKLYVNETLVASTIGISVDTLRTELHTGLSVTQVAAARNISVATLTGVLTTDMTTQINAALTAGRITQARATQLLADLPITIANYLNRIHYVRPYPTTTTTVAPTTTATPVTTAG